MLPMIHHRFLHAIALCLSLILLASCAGEPRTGGDDPAEETPRLVVGIVVDQMRHEYLQRFGGHFTGEGFRRLTREGFSFSNHHFNYFPTFTGPGHAAIYTGATPSVNGIVGNEWYDRQERSTRYVVEDGEVSTVGADNASGKMSPRNLQSTTLVDELESDVPGTKTVTVSLKDRGAILAAGHLGDAAYWYDTETGRFVSSSWYMEELPGWVEEFNAGGLAAAYSDSSWQLLLGESAYAQAGPDDSPHEGLFSGEAAPVFPHEMGGSPERIRTSPFGNTLVRKLAEKAVTAEGLGADDTTDFLGISFSSTDYVGHQYGPASVELADTYYRLDRDLAAFFDFLDREVGAGRYLVFLTSDHGVADVPGRLRDRGLPGGKFDRNAAISSLRGYLGRKFGPGARIEAYLNQQVYFDREQARNQGIDLGEMQRSAARYLLRYEGVLATNTAENFLKEEYAAGQQAFYDRGFHYRRSGDVFVQLRPGWLDTRYETGTTHGSPYNYDTHVPLLWMGPGIPRGENSRKTYITQIAPTLSRMLDISFPSGTAAETLEFK